ncbi:Mg/Co/Ni transporter MgtE [Streptosporangium becharense]|uniref:Mg/Co/Ni transporter MgtE n=1 Tax=Streptosporangium becharense TaxID=1816182 RepID=A0A7W9IGJ5_9ACTN|nr:hypothetical protein [Streptosporangium becharense]MBB2914839.1 Mg/Co/Ni transporter MgtE [Streptosporangium becharense]MBB5820350.1 Mg/Co/Ni transporter MgtE [Streptosporangium becharense]
MNLKHVGNVIFIVGTLALAGWVVTSPDSVPTPVLAVMIALCVAALVATFVPLLRRRSR